jgi:hypothetical protein
VVSTYELSWRNVIEMEGQMKWNKCPWINVTSFHEPEDEWIIVEEIDYNKIDQCHQLDEIYKFMHGYAWTLFKISCMKTTSMNNF